MRLFTTNFEDDFIPILYRGSYIQIKKNDIFNEDAPIVKNFPHLFKEYVENDEKQINNIDDFFQDINNNKNDVIIETK